jgi:hypothetical protein
MILLAPVAPLPEMSIEQLAIPVNAGLADGAMIC